MAHAVATDPPPDADQTQGCTRALGDQAASGSEDTIMGNSPTRNVDVFFRKTESTEAERPVRNESPVRGEGLTQQNGSVSEDLFGENDFKSASTRNENGEAREAAAAAESDTSVKDDVFIENDRSGSTASVQDDANETPENRASSESNAPAGEDCASPEKNGHAESDNLTGGTDNDGCRTQLAASNSASSESAASSDNGFTDSSGQQEKGVTATVPPPPQQLTGTSETPPSTKQRQAVPSGSKPCSRSSVDLALSPSAAKATVSEPTL